MIDLPRLLAMLTALLSMAVVFLFKTWADTRFLTLTGTTWLAHLLAAQAVLMIALSSLYARLVHRLQPLRLDLLSLLGTLLSGLLAPLLMQQGGAGAFAATLLMLSFPAIANLALWNSAQGVVSGRGIRNFLPKLGAVATGGAVLGSLAASQLSLSYGVAVLAPVASALTVLLIAVRLLLERYYPHGNHRIPTQQQTARITSKPLAADSRALITVLIIATLFETLIAGLVDFSFKRELTLRVADQQLAVFLALFHAATNGSMLLLQWFGAARLFSLYPLSRNILITPLAMIAMGLAWMLFPGLWVLVATRFTDGVLRFSIARPCLEISLTPLDRLTRRRWKVLLRGGYAQGGTVIAGLLLIAITPLLTPMPWLLPMLLLLAALGWLLAQHRVAQRYIQLLAHTIGRRQLSTFQDHSSHRPDRSAIAQALKLLQHHDPAVRRFTERFLKGLELTPGELLPHLREHAGEDDIRQVIYQLIAAKPSARWGAPLSSLVADEAAEASPVYLAALNALAACKHRGESHRARQLLHHDLPTDAGPWSDSQLTAAAYLARVSALRPGEIDPSALVNQLLERDGRSAGLTIQSLLQAQLLQQSQANALLATAHPQRCRGAMQAHALLATPPSLQALTEALIAGRSEADSAIPLLSGKALWRLMHRILAHRPSADVRRRLAWSLRSNRSQQSVREASRFIDDDCRATRRTAVRTLLHKRQEQMGDPPRDRYDRALDRQLQAFERLVRARAPESERRDTDLLDRELEQRCSDALDELAGLLALSGDPASIFSAQRSLRSPDATLRGQSLDALQEVMRGRRQRELIKLLELYLNPITPSPENRQRAATDPWLARCQDGSLEPISEQLLALRDTTLFRQLEGEQLEQLVRGVRCNTVDAGQTIIRLGEPGEDLFILLDGEVEVRTSEGHRRRLGYPAVFGEMSIADGSPRSATVTSCTPTRLLCIDRHTFLGLIDSHPEVGIGLLGVLAGWLRDERQQDPPHQP